MPSRPTAPSVRVDAPVPCRHCGLPVPAGLVDPAATDQFCCSGCRTVHEVLHSHGLERFYDVARATGEAPGRAAGSGRRYDEFDDPAFLALYSRDAGEDGGGLRRIDLYLEGVHCAACVWLVEKVPLAIDGVVEARLDLKRAQATVVWNPAEATLSSVARFVDSLGYAVHPYRGVDVRERRRAEDRALLLRMGLAGAVAGNVMLLAVALYAGFFSGMERQYEIFFRWLSLLESLPVLLYSAWPFFRGAWGALRAKSLHMDLPISIGLLAGFASGAVNTVRASGEIYFDSLTMLVLLLLAGRWLERRRQREAADAAELLYSLSPSTARRVETGEDGAERVREVPVEALVAGDLVDVRAGDALPADGVVASGDSELDRSLLTGESRPESVGPGDEAEAGAVNLTRSIRLRVVVAGEDTRVGRLMKVVEDAARRKAPVVRLADRVAGWFVGAVLALALATLVWWWHVDPGAAVEHAVALLIVSCPCALGLATPLAVSVAVGRAARAGILVRGGDALEGLARPGVLWLDKTGTLTEGRVALERFEGPADLLMRAAALEAQSQHPLARAIVQAARDREFEVGALAVVDAVQTLGGGIRGRVDGRELLIGSPEHVRERLGGSLGEWEQRLDELLAEALTPVVLAEDGRVKGLAGLGDRMRADAPQALRDLEARGWTLGILSGDHPAIVARAAERLGLDPARCHGGLKPEEKLAIVEADATRGPVVMVGDGVNDAAALSAATVGVGVHGGAEASLAAADVFLTRPGLAAVARLVEGARRTVGVIRRNLAFSLAYNLVGASLAIAGWIHPLLAAVLMPLSSITVVTVSFRSRTFDAER